MIKKNHCLNLDHMQLVVLFGERHIVKIDKLGLLQLNLQPTIPAFLPVTEGNKKNTNLLFCMGLANSYSIFPKISLSLLLSVNVIATYGHTNFISSIGNNFVRPIRHWKRFRITASSKSAKTKSSVWANNEWRLASNN